MQNPDCNAKNIDQRYNIDLSCNNIISNSLQQGLTKGLQQTVRHHTLFYIFPKGH